MASRIYLIFVVFMVWFQQDSIRERSLAYQDRGTDSIQWLVQGLDWLPPSPQKMMVRFRDNYLIEATAQDITIESPLVVVKEELESEQDDSFDRLEALRLVRKNEDLIATVPSTTPTAIVVLPKTVVKPAVMNSMTILVAGDSMAGDIGLSLRQLAQAHTKATGKPVNDIDGHRHSTGLVVESYYNWSEELPKLIKTYQPSELVFMIGANDGQGIYHNKTWVLPGTTAWNTLYSERIEKFLKTIPSNVHLYWLDLPAMKSDTFQKKVGGINAVVMESLKDCTNCTYIQTSSSFGETGAFTPQQLSLRAGDGIHYNRSGANLVAKEVWEKIQNPP